MMISAPGTEIIISGGVRDEAARDAAVFLDTILDIIWTRMIICPEYCPE